ncbi:bifunctional diaminohydroxyphosphoribosylaminopyrimidine deaminase/5-amino-6-(5-phosphoribosylamino)uracil reductase RibD [Paenarthrobacter sp. PH39-S1]|uniref:bifunctional diaminohydroxyphosphoribosylaminopyrimidine deaminase/5-amino-6-(5-phosphoribosylamino)uracil reductase RibD n=1 Tax=Paenarthrobacter sp. PH39-S1 TaxID=3046204 RepID=UPI0024B9798B|nr:bifunctional diaminohydroxyphosphoribosylaminopyrimidine deaminase/5-amino-6-(5-phosphoribosylamino)uracil reductase RibD [Paenarthrobacter sp. PH39-S1]MDJ0356372.1 bifunctional diaminohydroxyphosphoribosylaminopyrimidine deaminase/5-amino-6-(5-phosphoribosylamino)uracil reductase RibD [Paenarthrobacter sp. PH39-S1]
MDTALAGAALGVRGANPLVGAVVLDAAGKILSVGHHRGAGTAHAEVDALARVPAELTGKLAAATMVVTLEPCNHVGRTGPCAQAIIDAGIGRVSYAVDDPHQPAAGGARRLREAGVNVHGGLRADEAFALNRRWFASVRDSRPFITLHLAQTLDGRIAAADGTSQWITSTAARADNHGIRRLIDAILVGTETILVDNPRLTAREPDGSESMRQPLRVVMGLRDIPADAAVRGTNGVHGSDAGDIASNAGYLQLRTRDPLAAAGTLFAGNVRHLMVEGGSRISGAFLAAGLVDELIIYLAPTLLGSGVPALGDLGIGTLADAQQWAWDPAGGGPVTVLGPDLKLRLTPAAPFAAGTTGGN